MKIQSLKELVKHLTDVEASESPLLSCFVDLDAPRAECLAEIGAMAQVTARRLTGRRRADFEDAYSAVNDYLERSLDPASRGVAVYSRWGDEPMFVAMQFAVPLETQLVADDLPHIYPLIELKDTYHRFVIVITTETQVRVLETTLGAVTREILAARPELRQRIGREWTRQHYQNHKREREKKFIREKIRVIDDLMSRRGHNHLVIAGSPKMVNRMTKALPPRLKDKLVSTVSANPKSGIDPILIESVERFVAAENVESHDRVQQLESAVLTGGLGVAGTVQSTEAIAGGYADVLVVDQEYFDPGEREDLVRLATKRGVEIETVSGSEKLQRLSGVGCLLRFRPGFVVTGADGAGGAVAERRTGEPAPV